MALHPTTRARIRVLLIVALIGLGMAAFLWRLGRRSATDRSPVDPGPAGGVGSIAETPALSSPTTTPTQTPTTPSASPTPNAPGSETVPVPQLTPPAEVAQTGAIAFTPKLIIPVVGVRSDQLLDTFTDARSEGRLHDAIDIPAPAGTPVIAAADGEIVKLFQSDRGGTTIYQLSTDRKIVFYYAHLQRYADGLTVGKVGKQGEVIGYVGDTGNAGAGNYHLHFSISLVADPKRYWEGTNINPYPLLRR